jgi:hypothetical protein
VVLGGIGMVFTAILHPEGLAPAWHAPLQRLGRWLTTGPPGKIPRALLALLPGMIPGALLVSVWIALKATEWRNWHLVPMVAVGLLVRSVARRGWAAWRAEPEAPSRVQPDPASTEPSPDPASELLEA